MGKRKVIFLALFLLTLAPLISSLEFCNNRADESELEIRSIIDTEYEEKTTWPWEPEEDVTIEVELKNRNFSKRDFQIELYLLDEDENIKNNFTEPRAPTPLKSISLNEGESGTVTFSFKISENEGDIYYLYAKAYAENDPTICTSQQAIEKGDEANIEIVEEEKIITIKNITGPTTIIPGEEVKYTIEVSNAGNKKESNVLIVAYNAKMELRESKEILDLEVGIPKTATLNFTLPTNTTLTQEKILFTVEYDYDEEKDYYYRSSDKAKVLIVEISPTTTNETNQTQNQAATTINETATATTQTSNETAQEENSSSTSIPYLIPILITVLLIALVIAAVFFFLKFRKDMYLDEETSSPTPASTYVKNIQEKTNSSPKTPSKPSEKSTASTKTPPTSQNPAQ